MERIIPKITNAYPFPGEGYSSSDFKPGEVVSYWSRYYQKLLKATVIKANGYAVELDSEEYTEPVVPAYRLYKSITMQFNIGDRVQYNSANYPMHCEQGIVTGFGENIVQVTLDGKNSSISFSPAVLIKLDSTPFTSTEMQQMLDIVKSIGK